MKGLKFFASALVCSGLFFSSCQKEADETQVDENCKRNKGYYYNDNGTIEDSATYTYTGNNITRVTTSTNAYTLEYNNNNVVRRNYYNLGSNTIIGYDAISYNGGNQITKIERYDGAGTAATNWQNIEISYASGKVTKVIITEKSGSAFVPTYEYTYVYTGENITSVAEKEMINGQSATYTYTYAFDTKENYFKNTSSQFITTEPLFSEFDGSILPLFLSANNATAITLPILPIQLPIAYEVDTKANVTGVNVLGQPLIKYFYTCP